jgi:NADH dehydrogenase
MADVHMITGAFGYSGRAIATRLLDAGEEVRTITGHVHRDDPFGGRVSIARLAFDEPGELRRALEGVTVLYNTYWVRFDHGRNTHDAAVRNTRALIDAAVAAGVERLVHVSITNPSLDSPLPYFRGKAELEGALASSGLSHAILRPAVLFGGRDVLINNIAWLLRRLPLFAIAGDGSYGIQPIHVDDQAALAVTLGAQRNNVVVDAVGPEAFTFEELVRLVRGAVDSRSRILHVPPSLLHVAAWAAGLVLRDVVLTRDEIDGLMANLLVSDDDPTGTTRFTDWLGRHAEELGRRYANELKRHYR